jgi:hypothetical protein
LAALGIPGHVRLVTCSEVEAAMEKRGYLEALIRPAGAGG